VSTAHDARPVSDAEADALFAGLIEAPALVLAVSGGPDSTALLALAAAWRRRAKCGPRFTAVTIDHGLRPEAKREAAAVKRLAKRLGIPHRTMRWIGDKPSTSLQEKARLARYGLLAEAAREVGATHVVTAHTRDDQGETVLIRMARGSGLSGLAAMAPVTPLEQHLLVRPFLDVPKERLIATLRAAKLPFAEDPSNADPKFTRARLRAVMPQLATEGLGSERLARFARRARRADAAIEAMVDAASRSPQVSWSREPPYMMSIDTAALRMLPEEVALRLVGRGVAQAGDEGPVELGKLEALMAALAHALSDHSAAERFRRTLAGAVVTRLGNRIVIERAPTRRTRLKRAKSGVAEGRIPRKELFTKHS
jgi:tRNA(Ile)-lysidine synthase